MANHHDATKQYYGMGQKTLKSYITGLVLSLIFTFIAFGLVANHFFADKYIYIVLSVLAILQLFAQVIYFLRMSVSREGKWNSMPFLFVILIVLVLVFGTLWIMFNLNYNMVH